MASPIILLIAKLVFFALLLLLTAMNRFWLVPALMARDSQQRNAKTLLQLRYHVMSEQLLGLVIVAIVSFLGSIAPEGGG
ncbi:MAG TPA: CopD family protein [Geobacterales bacterium]|jgi:putative copper resistance protein D|nr:CopD family protein [Geobacterales bacterium]